jgi:hypothetical protein
MIGSRIHGSRPYAALFALLVGVSGVSPAATINVTASAPDSLATNGSCSLREAISNINAGSVTYPDCPNASANVFGVSDTINIPAGTYTNAIPTTHEDLNADGDLDVLKSVALVGAGATSTFIDGGAIDRVFHIDPTGTLRTVSISGVTIRNGSSGAGGGIMTAALLTITNSIITNNTVTGDGGGISSQGGKVTLVNSTLSNNTGGTGGIGGFDNENDAFLDITNSTISGNTGGKVGGIYSKSSPPGIVIHLTNSTISGNQATGANPLVGGIFFGLGTMFVVNSTITLNSGTTGGLYSGDNGGGGSDYGFIELRNTIVAGNAGPNCSSVGVFVNNGNNIDGGTTCVSTWGGSMQNTNPMLGPLALNAPGTTQTHALLPGSPAIDGATFSPPNGGPATDQRGVARPQGAGYDIGAYEVTAPATKLAFVQQPTNASAGATIVPAVTVQLQDAGGGSVAQAGVSVSLALASGTGALSGTTPQTTSSAGLATFSNLSVNLVGAKTLAATSAGLTAATSSSFAISAGTATSLIVSGGGTQSTTVSTPFGTPLQVLLTDAQGNPVSGAQVPFTPPASGASAVITGSPATTDAAGHAQVTATANASAGSYNVTASFGTLPPVSFALTNTAAPQQTNDVPALSTWGLAALVLSLAGVSVVFLRLRQG